MISNAPAIIAQILRLIYENNLDECTAFISNTILSDYKNIGQIFEAGVYCAENGRLDEAFKIFSFLQPYAKNDARIPYNLGILYEMSGDKHGACQCFQLAIQIEPKNIEASINLSSTYIQLHEYEAALSATLHALKYADNSPEVWSNKGIALNNLKLYEEAIQSYDEALNLNSKLAQVWLNRSLPLYSLGRFIESLESCNEALNLKPDYPEAWLSKAMVSSELNRYNEALEHYDRALTLRPDYAEAWSNKGNTLYALKRYNEALEHYDRALTLRPDYAEAWSNRGNTLCEVGRYNEALEHYDRALTLRPAFPEAFLNKGVALKELKYYCQSMVQYDQALNLKPDYAEAWSNKAAVLNELKRYEEALIHYEKALSLKFNIDWVYGDLIHLKMKICSWDNLEQEMKTLIDKVKSHEKIIQPFPLLSLTDDPLQHKKASEIYVREKYPPNHILGNITKNKNRRKKIRLGYFSADFCNHATGDLAAELFELHDRKKFETFAFSFGPDDLSPMRSRLTQAFDQFIEVGNMSDIEVANLSRKLGIDIAVDLKGFTQDARPGIFAYRVAPLQVNYLGFPGTLGADYYEYIISDNIVTPKISQDFYVEKIISLPDSYQANDRKRFISTTAFTKIELGIPRDAFVYCCFNNNYKILPATFEGWMRILKKVEGSFLWLLGDNSLSVGNLKNFAERSNVDPSRIIFSERVVASEHLARHRAADLFLDTYPYNAHTTASDALWAGLPVLTMLGNSFASRVAGSLLTAIGLPDLITTTRGDYEALAIELALNPEKLASIKKRLDSNRLTTPLFDTPRFTRNLEDAYLRMIDLYLKK